MRDGWIDDPRCSREERAEIIARAAQEQARSIAGQSLARLEQQVTALQQKVAYLEGPGKLKLIDQIGKGTADAIKWFLEAHGYMRYRGVWAAEHSYRAGDLVSHSGAAWVAVGDVVQGDIPGRGPAWKMAVKSGAGS